MPTKYAAVFVAGFAASSGSSALVANAASGDLTFNVPRNKVVISQAQFAAYAQQAIDDGVWSGAAANLSGLTITQSTKMVDAGAGEAPVPSIVYHAHAEGVGSGTAADIDALRVSSGKNIRVIGKVE
jgi:hypothetical protein